jgi:uncharacterized protein (DUF4415 family)
MFDAMPKPRRICPDTPDDEHPERTLEDFRRARPALEVIAEWFGAEAAEELRQGKVTVGPGRPPKPEPERKVNQTLRLDPDVIAAWRASGPGWQARINSVLRAHMPRDRNDTTSSD